MGNIESAKKCKVKANYTAYCNHKNNLSNLKPGEVEAIISSPPYEGSLSSGECGIDLSKATDLKDRRKRNDHSNVCIEQRYSAMKDNLGNSKGQTFWEAAKIIVLECFKILKPGGHCIFVVKDFVRNKRRVDFTGDWRKLCESVGFETLHEHHAMLVKEEKHKTLFGHTEKKVKERKSFFRRLAESKGSPRIDFECVLCMRKP